MAQLSVLAMVQEWALRLELAWELVWVLLSVQL